MSGCGCESGYVEIPSENEGGKEVELNTPVPYEEEKKENHNPVSCEIPVLDSYSPIKLSVSDVDGYHVVKSVDSQPTECSLSSFKAVYEKVPKWMLNIYCSQKVKIGGFDENGVWSGLCKEGYPYIDENGYWEVHDSIPIKSGYLWHDTIKTVSGQSVIGDPLSFPFLPVSDSEGNIRSQKPHEGRVSVILADGVSGQFGQYPLSNLPKCSKGALPQSKEVEIVGYPSSSTSQIKPEEERCQTALRSSFDGLVFGKVVGDSAYSNGCDSGFKTVFNVSSKSQVLEWLGISGSGASGASAYEVAVENGFSGTAQEWLESLIGDPAPPATNGVDGTLITIGENGNWFLDGVDSGVLAEGSNGIDGADGQDGTLIAIGENGNWFLNGVDSGRTAIANDGSDGLSAYESWLQVGNSGTEIDFVNSITGSNGSDGEDGLSSFDIWKNEGNLGNEADFLESIRGVDGVDGSDSGQEITTSFSLFKSNVTAGLLDEGLYSFIGDGSSSSFDKGIYFVAEVSTDVWELRKYSFQVVV